MRSLCTLGGVAVAHLVYAVKSVLHALDGIVFPILDVLRLEHLAERALPLLGYQPVLPHPPAAAAEATTNLVSVILSLHLALPVWLGFVPVPLLVPAADRYTPSESDS